MSTIHITKYYFYKNHMPKDPKRLRQMIAVAYQTARDRQIFPKAVLIRSDVHDTTSINGIRQKDPKGLHITLCYKDEAQLVSGNHVASHGYIAKKGDSMLKEATHTEEKPDSTIKSSGHPVWPSDSDKLQEAPDIGYGHFS